MPVAATNGCAAASGTVVASGTSCGASPAVIAWQNECSRGSAQPGRDAAVGGRVPVDLAQDQLGLADLGEVGQLHPEHLAGSGEQSVHRVVSARPRALSSRRHRTPLVRRLAAPAPARGARGTWLIACSASAVMVRLGFDADVRRDRGTVAHQQIRIAEHALARVDDAGRTASAPITAPPRMCAVVGMFAAASVSELCAIAAGALGQPRGELVGDGDEGRVRALGILLGAQPHAAGPACARRAARSRCRATASRAR